jgi:uncharacterized protein YecE (DUF72 family)
VRPRLPARIGTAGWSIPKPHAANFPQHGSHLERYAARLSAVEINSSFYRPHKPATYARWAASVPPTFRFAVKVPREITHSRKLVDIVEPLEQFLSEVVALAHTLGPLLVQLPPSLRYDPAPAETFLNTLRGRSDHQVVLEPRHPTWFTDEADALLSAFRIARVAADPAVVPRAAEPGGWPAFVYRRLHGSPRTYYSPYSAECLDATAQQMRETSTENWCIFDNTAVGEATADAISLQQRLRLHPE